MKRYGKILLLLSKFSVKSMTRSPLGVMLFTAGKLVRFGMFFMFVFYLVSQTTILRGYTTQQAIIVLMTFELLTSVGGLVFRETYRFRHLVISGGFDNVLTKPYHPFIKILLGGLDPLDAFVLVIQLFIMGYLVFVGGYGAFDILLYAILFMNAFIVLGALHIFALSMGILTLSVDQILMILRDVVETGRFPIEIYKQPLRWFLTFIIPVGVMTTFPARGLIGLVSVEAIVSSGIVALVMLYVNFKFWEYSLQRYQSWGG